ncbi:MAG: protein kinase [Planctomycetes bacterium]|nr:protein kinase [Planctomycetota bacterium]
MVERTEQETERLALRTYEALLDVPAGEREARLDELRADQAVRARVRELLARDSNAAARARGAEFDALTELLGDRVPEVAGAIGGYEIVRQIGRGGMGEVYEARQRDPARTVAIKVLRHGLFDADARRRFEDEARLLAHLRHPAIAQVIEAGVHTETTATGTRELPFLVLEYVPGARTLVDHAQHEGLPLAARLRLLVEVALAVHHGHQKGVIHRDLKPANLLVGEDGRPKVIDFGVASVQGGELARTTAMTQAGQVIGTIGYIAPEALAGEADVADVRADVYALGAVAFELATGVTPFDLDGVPLAEAARRVTTTSPRRPREAAPGVDPDLAAVLLQAIAREPADRYASAAALADDLGRWLGSQPVVARRPGAARRLRLFARRNPPLAAAIVALLLVIVGALAGVLWIQHAAIATAERDGYRTGIIAVAAMADTGETGLAHDLLANAPPGERAWEWRHLDLAFESSERGNAPFRAYEPRGTSESGAYEWSRQVLADFDLDRDAKRLVVGHPNGKLLVLDAADGTELAAYDLDADVRFVRFAGEHAVFCAGLGDRAPIRLVDLRDGSSQRLYELPDRGVVNSVAVSDDGRFGASAGATSPFRGGEILVFDLARGARLHRLGNDDDPPVLRVEFAADGRYVFAGNFRGEITRWDLRAEGGPQALRMRAERFEKHGNLISCLARSTDGKRLASVGGESIAVWQIDSLQLEAVMTGAIQEVGWTPHGDQLVVSQRKNPIVALAAIADGPALLSAPGLGHEAMLSRIVAIEQGRRVFTSAYDGTIRVWRLDRLAARHALNWHTKAVRAVAASNDGERVVSIGSADRLVVWDRASGRRRAALELPQRVNAIAADPGSDQFVLAGRGLWRLDSLEAPALTALGSIDGELNDVAWRPNGSAFATASSAGVVTLHDPQGGALVERTVGGGAAIKRVAFSASGERLLTGTVAGALEEWSGTDLTSHHTIGEVGEVTDIAYLPGSDEHVLSASVDRRLILWRRHGDDAFEPQEIDRGRFLQRIEFHPTEARMFTCSTNGRVTVWDTTDWHRIVTLPGHRTMIIDSCFVPMSDELVTSGMDRTVRIWRTAR